MAQLNPSVSPSRRAPHRASTPPAAETETLVGAPSAIPLTSSQEEILGLLDGSWSHADDRRQAAQSSEGLGADVVLAAVGAAGILAGMALLFFATALGAVVLVLGCLTCTLAFEHALVADTAIETLKQVAATENAEVDEALADTESTLEH